MKSYLIILFLLFLLNNGRCKYNMRIKYKYSLGTLRMPTKYTKPITIPVLLHFDKALTDLLYKQHKIKSRRKLKEISRRILKDAESFFLNPSLNQPVTLKLYDTRFLRKSKIPLEDNATTYLKNYCLWQGERKLDTKKWWFSVLLTGLDLYYLNESNVVNRNSTGRGYLGGMCAASKSCTLIEWNPRNIGYLLTHEIGHSLGMAHDGVPHNSCKPLVNIMSSRYHPLHHPSTWSKCNNADLQKFLRSRKGWCLKKY